MVVDAGHRGGSRRRRRQPTSDERAGAHPVLRSLRPRRPDAPRRTDADDRRPRDPALAARPTRWRRSERHLPPAQYRAIAGGRRAIERELRELREGVMRVRLVPVGEIFRRMPFVVRDLARDSGRSVNVVLSGQDTKIDKFLVERMMDPVLHLVRNAVSHGIETPAERRRRQARRGDAALERQRVRRDRGDRDCRRRPRHRRGARGRARAASRAGGARRRRSTPRRCSSLISAPGFSTRDESDRVSGRGVGMNVVRETLQELRRHDPARDRARRGHALRHRAAADAVDHRRDDRARRRSDLRGAAGRRSARSSSSRRPRSAR